PEGTTVLGSLTDGKEQHIGSAGFKTQTFSAYDSRFDLPTETKNAEPYLHTTTTVYHPLLGQPTSVTDVNGATVTTTYDALGRATDVVDVLKGLAARTRYAATTGSVNNTSSNWTARRS